MHIQAFVRNVSISMTIHVQSFVGIALNIGTTSCALSFSSTNVIFDFAVQGKAGIAATIEELAVALRSHDLFLYFGHGSGMLVQNFYHFSFHTDLGFKLYCVDSDTGLSG